MEAESFRNPARNLTLEVKIAILRERAEQKKVTLPKDVALYIAQNVQSTASALEGALALVIAHSSLVGTDITLNYAKTILENFIGNPAPRATVDPFQRMLLRQGATKGANRTRQAPTAANRPSIFRLLETLEGRKIRRVREVLEVNMREYEREQLAGRDGYERELERRAKKRKRG
ncbi:MAG: DnaA/Hda family protein [Terriglobales bacterium]